MQRPNPATTMFNLGRGAATAAFLLLVAVPAFAAGYAVVGTGQTACYDDLGTVISCPAAGEPFHGQDAQHTGNPPRYVDHGDGTITDAVTGLMWQQTPELDKSTFAEATAGAATFRLAGYDDWRLPTIKELYSLIDFDGVTATSAAASTPYLDTAYFDFYYGDESAGERFIDAQFATSTEYVGTTMGGEATMFGVNFADGRIKGYGYSRGKTFYVLHVRGATGYGTNDFVDNGDGTITDEATGLMWSQSDSGEGLSWEEALTWVARKNADGYLGHDDWRLPDAKELQSIVDYSRAPDVTDSAAIDPIFEVTPLQDGDYPYFWTSTTHLDGPPDMRGSYAAYVAFGRAMGYMEWPPGSGNYQLQDVHGAGAQRSDPKSGNPGAFPFGHGPQGDVISIYNYVRPVRDAGSGGTGDQEPDLKPPATPKRLRTAVVGRRAVRLRWNDKSDDEDGFEIQSKVAGGSFGQVAVVESDVRTCRDSGLEPDTTYVYRIRAFNAAGSSDWSNRVRVTTEP